MLSKFGPVKRQTGTFYIFVKSKVCHYDLYMALPLTISYNAFQFGVGL
jgi:hypothetical protein